MNLLPSTPSAHLRASSSIHMCATYLACAEQLHPFITESAQLHSTSGSRSKPDQRMWAKSKRRFLLSIGLVFGASFISYLSSLDGDFVFDDHRGILTNDDLDSSKTSLYELFQHDFWGGLMSRVESHKSYRPLTVLTFRYLNFYWSELRPYGYHLVNVLFHSTASVIFLLLCEMVVGGEGSELTYLGLPLSWSTIGALLFAVHSIHTEAVSVLAIV